MELLIVTVVATIVGTLLALEAKAWLPYLGRKVLSRAVARFPEEIGESTRRRWAKEIEGDFREFDDRPLSGLLFALRVLFKGGRDLAAELALEEKIAESEAERRGAVGAAGRQLVLVLHDEVHHRDRVDLTLRVDSHE